jgi:hypothetical protein
MTTMFVAKAWQKSSGERYGNRRARARTTPIWVSVGRKAGGVVVEIDTDTVLVSETFPDVSDAQLFVLRITKSQNLADWVALALPEAVSA